MRSKIDYGANYCEVHNDPVLTESFQSFTEKQENVFFVKAKEAMTGEDFGYF